MPVAQAVQLNVRMDRAARDAGNRALAELAISPSEFVRRAWAKLAQRGEAREAVLAAVEVPELSDETERRLAAFQAGDEIVLKAMERLGISEDTHITLGDEELAQSWYEHLFAKGMR